MIDSDQRSASREFTNRHPYQIIRTMVNILLSNRRPFQNEDLYVFLPCHLMDVGQYSTSSALHIISNECKTSKFQV